MADELSLDRILELFEQDKEAAALQLLERYLKENPRDAQAWWIAASRSPNRATKIQCLKRLFKLNPEHEGALALAAGLLDPTEIPTPKNGSPAASKSSEPKNAADLDSYAIKADMPSADSLSDSSPKSASKSRRASKTFRRSEESSWTRNLVLANSLLLIPIIVLLVMNWFQDREQFQTAAKTTTGLHELQQSLSLVSRNMSDLQAQRIELKSQFNRLQSDLQTQNAKAASRRSQMESEMAQERARLEAGIKANAAEKAKLESARATDSQRRLNSRGGSQSDPQASSEEESTLKDGANEVTVRFPGTVKDALPSTAGRSFVCRLESNPGLTVVDMVQRKVSGTIRIPNEDILFATGGEKVLIYFKSNNLFQVWSLKDFKLLKTKPNPIGTIVTALVMGHSNDDVALVRSAIGTGALDQAGGFILKLANLEPLIKEESAPQGRRGGGFSVTGHNGSFRDFVHYCSNGNLTLVSEWCTSHSPSGMGVLRIEGGRATPRYEHTSAGSLLVGDDERIYTSSGLIYNSQLTRLGQLPGMPVPGIGGAYVLALGTEFRPQLYQSGGTTPILSLDPLKEFSVKGDQWSHSSFTMDRRIVFAPQVGYLAYLPPVSDKLIIRPFDLDKVLAASGVDYLLVSSVPPLAIRSGMTWDYQLEVKQKEKRPVKYSLQSAPDGMAVSEAGKVTWKIGTEQGKTPEKVIMLIENDKGDSTFHTFELRPHHPPPKENSQKGHPQNGISPKRSSQNRGSQKGTSQTGGSQKGSTQNRPQAPQTHHRLINNLPTSPDAPSSSPWPPSTDLHESSSRRPGPTFSNDRGDPTRTAANPAAPPLRTSNNNGHFFR